MRLTKVAKKDGVHGPINMSSQEHTTSCFLPKRECWLIMPYIALGCYWSLSEQGSTQAAETFLSRHRAAATPVGPCSPSKTLFVAQFFTRLTMTNAITRKRTFTGCITCRQRRSKCDEKHPTCGSCERLGIRCEGYGPKLVWVTDGREHAEGRQSHRGAIYRYPLFSGL